MCGRYGLYDISESEILQNNKGYTFKPNYNVAPTQAMPIITQADNGEAVRVMEWGISRKLGPDVEKNIFNTRSDKAFGRFWGKTIKSTRCLVPANGFYEWRKSESGKFPFWIYEKNRSIFYFAGIYSEDSEGKLHYSIMTTTPNKEMSHIHDRMPVILEGDAKQVWLDAENTRPDLLEEILRPLPDGSLVMFEVSREVNAVRNNDGRLILPVNSV